MFFLFCAAEQGRGRLMPRWEGATSSIGWAQSRRFRHCVMSEVDRDAASDRVRVEMTIDAAGVKIFDPDGQSLCDERLDPAATGPASFQRA